MPWNGKKYRLYRTEKHMTELTITRNNNWDQGLLNLGFTETERLSQDFNTFCQLPEPMSNDLVQQLLTDAELTGPFSGGMSGLPDPHVLEASHTLQSIFKSW
jgi:hypothetical protein